MYLLKIAFPYWSNVCFGCDWHILTSELALLSVSQKDENPALFPVISIRCRLAHRPIPFLLLGSLGIGKRCFESRNYNTCSNPFIDGFLVLSKAQQGVLRVTRRLFGYCRKVAAARYVSSYSKPSGYSRKPCRLVAPPKSGNLFLTYGILILFLVVYAKLFHLAV